MTKELEEKCEELAFNCYTELCPHAPKVDKSVEPHIRWPASKSTTQQGFINGFQTAMELKQEAVEGLLQAINNFIAEDMPYYPFATRKLMAEKALQNYERFKNE